MSECDEVLSKFRYPGRNKDLCECKGHDDRPDPRVSDCNKWREQRGLPLLEVDDAKVEPRSRPRLPKPQSSPEPQLGRYPGANLALLLQKCGVHVNTGCGCEEWISKMNAWGVEGCYEHRQEIVDRLSEQAKKLTTAQIAWTGILMMWHGIRPTIGELVDEAIWSASNVIANDE